MCSEQACLDRKNRLARYTVDTGADKFEPVVVCIEERLLRIFQEKHQIQPATFSSADTFLNINRNPLIPNFIRSLEPYYDQVEKINQSFEDVKNEELLIILLKSQPELAGVLFDYGSPAKIDLEAFMNRNYTFNVSIDRFAYLTGRSLSAFKRDFKQELNDTPNHWLVKRRLQESHFLIDQKNKKPTEIYLDLGFEDLSHFSHAFKKLFGLTPTELSAQKKPASQQSVV
jgi:AraC-like DNA-binding protein